MYEPGFIYGKGGVKIARVSEAPAVLGSSGRGGRGGGRGGGGYRREYSREGSLRREDSFRRDPSPRTESPLPRGPAADRFARPAQLFTCSLAQLPEKQFLAAVCGMCSIFCVCCLALRCRSRWHCLYFLPSAAKYTVVGI